MNACPSREQLQDFTIGELDDETAGQIAQHVDTCTRCQTSLEEIDDEADLRVAALLAPPGKSPHADDPEFQRALAEIQSIDLKQPYKTKEVIQNPGTPDKPVPSNLVEIGQYRLLAKLGEGGMGAVYKALHTKLDKLVALKILPRERTRDPQAVARFEREMKAVGRLEHANIVRAMDANEQDGTHYLVMEYVDGVDLSELVQYLGPLPIPDACRIVQQAAEALTHAHANGLIHRDIKPSNIMVESRGLRVGGRKATVQPSAPQPSTLNSQPSVKLLDLGLARLQEQAVEDLTSTGQAMGTLDYMAPEQCDDSHAVDARADIYSLGATLYKLLTGHAPFSGSQFNTPTKKLAALLTKPTPPIADRRSGLPEPLAEIIHRLLAKEPDQRPATAGEVAELLAPYTENADLTELVNQLPQETTEMMTDATTLARPDALDAPHHGTDEYLSSSMTETHPGGLKEKAPSGATGSASAVVAPGNQQVREKDEAAPPDEASDPVPGTPRSFPDLGHEPDRSSSQPSARRILPPRMAVALAAGLIGVIALGVILYINTDHGRLVIDTKVDDVKVIVESGGGKVTIIDPQAERTVNLSPGEYDVRLEDEKAGLALSTKSFTMRRGKEVVVEVRYEPKVGKHEPTKPDRPPSQPSVGQWKPGPAEDVMVGVLPRPAKLPGIRRWQIETAMPRSDIYSMGTRAM